MTRKRKIYVENEEIVEDTSNVDLDVDEEREGVMEVEISVKTWATSFKRGVILTDCRFNFCVLFLRENCGINFRAPLLREN